MSTATATRRRADTNPAATMPAAVVATRRRAPMRIVAGLLAIGLGFVVGAAVLSNLDRAVDVLSVARAVSAGSVLTDADLSTPTEVGVTGLRARLLRSLAYRQQRHVQVTATITWQVTWAGGGATGAEPALTSTASVQVAVVEPSAVNTRP
jgi:hypothetical protein